MRSHRRDFFRVLAAAASSAALGSLAHGDVIQGDSPQAPVGGFDPDAAAYWTQLFQRGPSPTLGPGEAGDARTPRFYIHTQKDGFRFPTSPPVKPEELEKVDRPNVKLRVVAFKPSTEDSKKFDASQSGTLRVDALQQGMLEASQPDAKASTTVSGQTVSGNAKLNPSSVSGITIGGEQAITLPGGGGHLNWAFFLQQKTAVWHMVLAIMIKASGLAATSFAPALNLGTVSKAAWGGLNSMMGGVMPVPNQTQNAAKATFWLLTPGLVPVAASQSAFQDPSFANGLPLIKTAYYVVVPQEHYKMFGDAMDKMIVEPVGGYVVPKQTKPQDVFDAAYSTPELKDVSYLTVLCEAITEAPTTPCDNKTPSKAG